MSLTKSPFDMKLGCHCVRDLQKYFIIFLTKGSTEQITIQREPVSPCQCDIRINMDCSGVRPNTQTLIFRRTEIKLHEYKKSADCFINLVNLGLGRICFVQTVFYLILCCHDVNEISRRIMFSTLICKQ